MKRKIYTPFLNINSEKACAWVMSRVGCWFQHNLQQLPLHQFDFDSRAVMLHMQMDVLGFRVQWCCCYIAFYLKMSHSGSFLSYSIDGIKNRDTNASTSGLARVFSLLSEWCKVVWVIKIPMMWVKSRHLIITIRIWCYPLYKHSSFCQR